MTRRFGRAVPVLALAVLVGCGPANQSGVIVGDGGVGVRADAGDVRAQVGPDDAAIGVAGDRVVAGVGTEQAAAGVRVDDRSPLVVGAGTTGGGGLFGGLGMGF